MGTVEGFAIGSTIFLFILFGYVAIHTQTGTLVVTQSFENEYKDSQAQLLTCRRELINATTPQCAPVTIKQGIGDYVLSIFGMILWITGLLYWNYWAPKKFEESKKEKNNDTKK